MMGGMKTMIPIVFVQGAIETPPTIFAV